jgi:hypothetical protein
MSFSKGHFADKLYYDIVISNIDSKDSPPTSLYFNEVRNSPFVYKPEDYYLSIVRFTLDTPSLPIWTCIIQNNQPDVNLSIYSITLSWTNPLNGSTFFYQKYLEFAPQVLSSQIPIPPSQTVNGLQNNSTGYYYVYNYQYVIFLVNQCFQQCFIELNNLVVSAGYSLPTAFAPILTFDTQLNIAILNSDILGYNTNALNYIKIFMNSALFQLFSSFPIYILGSSPNGQNIQIQTYTFGGQNIAEFPSNALFQYNAIQTFQEYSTISLWTPVLSIVFCSNTLPIVPNQISAPQILVNGSTIINDGNNSNIANIITDLVVADGNYKPSIVYNPTAQYRLIEMQGNRPLNNLDIVVYWKDRYGILNPFTLTSGSSATLKILFSKKSSDGNYK